MAATDNGCAWLRHGSYRLRFDYLTSGVGKLVSSVALDDTLVFECVDNEDVCW